MEPTLLFVRLLSTKHPSCFPRNLVSLHGQNVPAQGAGSPASTAIGCRGKLGSQQGMAQAYVPSTSAMASAYTL